MTDKEKTQAYDEALARAREIHRNEDDKVKDMEFIFPELKESEDERISKALIFYLGDMPENTELRNGITNSDVFAWLRKQKPVEWSEEDEKYLQDAVDYFYVDNALQHSEKEIIKWLKSLKERMK